MTLEMSDADFVAMATGQADAQKLYFGGKLKISGNVMASQKLEFLKQVDAAAAAKAYAAKHGEEARRRSGSGRAWRRPSGRAPSSAEPGRHCAALKDKLAKTPAFEIVGVIQFDVKSPDKSFFVDAKAVTEGRPRRPGRRCASTRTTSWPSSKGRRRLKISSCTASYAWTATCASPTSSASCRTFSDPHRSETKSKRSNPMSKRVNVIGVGMVKFAKPGASEEYNVMAAKAMRAALEDSKTPYGEIQQAFCGYVYGDSTCGQRAVYDVGLTGIPVFNVNNNCSTGSTALMLATQAVDAGMDCVLAVGFEKMEKRRAREQVQRPDQPARSTRRRDERHAGLHPGAGRGADVRRRGARVPVEVRDQARDVREDQREGAQARGEQPVRALQHAAHGRGDPRERRGLRPAHALPVLPAHVRRGGGDPLLGRVREEARRLEPGLHRRAGDADRLPDELRAAEHDQDGRLRHDQGGLEGGLREGRRRSGGRGRDRAPRLLHRERGCSRTRRSASAPRGRRRSSSGTGTIRTGANGW